MATTVKKKATTAKPRKTVAQKDQVATVAKVEKVVTPKPRKAAATKNKVAGIAAPIKLTPPTREQIEQLARKYWAERGYQDGQAEQDWLRAEHDLQQKAS
jgi:hypothetical protein